MRDIRIKDRKSIKYGVNRRQGFTLAEMLVVVAIIAVLAAVGVATAIGFINKSQYDQNTQNAVTIYQTAQTALTNKVDNGTISDWVESTFTGTRGFTDNDFLDDQGKELLDETNKSIHKSAYLTYNPGGEHQDSEKLKSLLSGYFYDASIFTGTISVEFDLVATKLKDGSISYSATVVAAYYSKENKAPSAELGGGWDKKCTGKQDCSPEYLPDTNPDYLRYTSRVGYYNGSNLAEAVRPVVLPNGITEIPEEKLVFTLRNGETLDVNWAIVENPEHNAELMIKLIDLNDEGNVVSLDIKETSLLYDLSSNSNVSHSFAENDYLPQPINGVLSDSTVVNEYITDGTSSYRIRKTSVEGLARIGVTKTGQAEADYIFPITISSVQVFEEDGTPRTQYTLYSLSLDCMMTRFDYESYPIGNANRNKLFCSDRLFGQAPLNIYATIEGTASGNTIELKEATRSIDDPIYFTGVENKSTTDEIETNLCYNTGSAQAVNDTTYGKCIVNTLFGDISNGSFLNGSKDAVITSFRHLSNMRFDSESGVNYKIMKDLNWYIPATASTKAVSEVKVFASYVNTTNRKNLGYANYRFHSPIEGGKLKIVSFPALKELYSGQSLSASTRSDGKSGLYSINNVQMRVDSFISINNNKVFYDEGIGLICKNSGNVYDIYTNNLNIVLTRVTDGSDDDYSKICPTGTVTISGNTNRSFGTNNTSSVPVGGLIGKNTGSVGRTDGVNSSIVMSNCIVMSGNYWSIQKYEQGTGGIIGTNSGTNTVLTGTFEVNGSFVVAGHTCSGGIIGECTSGTVKARFFVNKTTAPYSEFNNSLRQLPVYNNNNTRMTCAVIAWQSAGGVFGHASSSKFDYSGDTYFKDTDASYDAESRSVVFNGSDSYNYGIDVNMDSGALVLMNGRKFNNNVYSAGGAIGQMSECTGDHLDIRVNNSGYVVGANTDMGSTGTGFGGAVGYDLNNKISKTYVEVNNSGSTIGYLATNKGPCFNAGGAYGYVSHTNTGDVMAVNVVNSETTISARFNGDGNGSGGAIGGIGDKFKNKVFINVDNKAGTLIQQINNNDTKANGVGGAIGGMYSNNNTYLETGSVVAVTNSGSISGQYRVGGVIGSSGNIKGKIYATANSSASIQSTKNHAGGAIGYISPTLSTSGTIDSLLQGNAVVTVTNENAGGAVGYVDTSNGSMESITAVLDSSAKVSGSKSVGGTVGRYGGNATIISSVLNASSSVSGKDNIGGAIGYYAAGSVSNLTSELNSEGIVQGTTYTGGAVGGLYAGSISSITSTLNSNGKVSGNKNTGGAVGHIAGGTVSSISVVTNSEAVISGTDYTGGAIGYFSVGTVNAVSSNLNSQKSVTGNDYTGGAVGGIISGSISTITAGLYSKECVSGNKSVGGAIGYIAGGSATTVTADMNSETSVYGKDNTGGAIGYFKDGSSGTITSNMTVQGSITGSNCTGGAIGRLEGGSLTSVTANLNSSGDITGTDYVGGVIGYYVNVTLESLSSELNSTGGIVGTKYVGGTIGYFGSGTITTVSAVLGSEDSVSGSDYIGGAIGQVAGGNITNVTADLSASNSVSGTNYVGGAIGYSGTGTITNVTAKLITSGQVKGTSYVGGALGYLASGSIETVLADLDAEYSVTGSDTTGGAVGRVAGGSITTITANLKSGHTVTGGIYTGGVIGSLTGGSAGTVTADFGSSGQVSGTDHTGGIIGTINGGNTDSVSVTLNSENSVSGSDYVGGAIGSYVKGSTSNVTVSLKSLGSVTGANYVGGAIGRVAGGSITSVASDVYANSAIGGGAYIGGTVGTVDGGTITTASLVLHGVYYPVAQKSGSNPGEACIGGVIGRINNGTVTNAKLSGEGGSIDLSSNFGKTYSNAMLINANGSSLGGVIGQVVAGSSSKIYNIEVDSVNICVVSSDGSDNIGGWIGSCYGQIGQSGTVFNVNSVKLVYSSGNNVGGFCGSFGSGSSNSDTLYSSLSVVLDGAYITGRSGVGGIFGRIDGAKLETGNANRIEVKLTNETRVGDFRGTVGGSLEGCICYNAGGAIGCYTAITTISGNNSGSNRLWVEIDPTSMVFAGADSGHPETDGVGGAIGIFGTAGNNNSPSYGLNSINEECDAYISVYCESPEPSVYSGFTNAGGVFGFMAGGKVRYCFSTAVVRSDGISEGIGTGGFIGKMDAGTIYGSYSGGHTNTDNMYSEDSPNVIGLNNVGGLIGLMGQNVTSVQDCYSTSSVSGLNYVGGFIGHIVEENKNANVVKSTYSTGSVFGSEPDPEAGVYIGAFVGFAPDDRNGDGKLIFFEHSSSNKYVAFTNPTSMPIVGNIESVERAAIFGAFWTGDGNNWYGTNYIRVNPLSTYNAYPFNENLKSAVDAYFPLRTYVSYFTGEEMVYEGDNKTYKIYYGVHYGDWPMPYDGFGKKAISSCAEAVINGSYTYDPSNPTAIDPTNDLVLTSTVEQNTTLVLGVDYEVTGIRNNTNAGTANIVLNGIGDYFGTLTVDFQIAPANLEDLDVDVVVGPETTPGTDGSLVPGYAVRLFFSNDTIKDLFKDTDYEAALYDADDGSHVIKISGKGNYTGEIIVPYCIVSFESDADNKVYSVVRSGEYVTPPDVSKEGSTLLYWYYLNASNEETEFDLSAPVTSDAELFAKWEEDNPGDNPGDGSGEGSGEGAGDAGGNTDGNTDGNTTEGDAASGDTNGGDTTGGNAATGDQNDMTTPPAVTGDDTSNDSDDDSGSGEGGGEQGGDTGSGEGGTSTDQQTGGEQGGDSSSSSTDGINDGDYD